MKSKVIVLSSLLFVGMQQTHVKWTLQLNHQMYFSAFFLAIQHMIRYWRYGSFYHFMICQYNGVKPLENLVNIIIFGCFVQLYILHEVCEYEKIFHNWKLIYWGQFLRSVFWGKMGSLFWDYASTLVEWVCICPHQMCCHELCSYFCLIF